VSTERDSLILVRIDFAGLGALGLFDTFEPPEAGAEVTTYTPGGAVNPIVFGGRKTIGEATVARYWLPARDRPLLAALLQARGTARGNISDTSADGLKNPNGAPVVFPGVLMGVQYPNRNSEGDDTAMLTLTFACEEPVA
jgi:hypothetical protein